MSSLRLTPLVGHVTWIGIVEDSEKDIRAKKANVLELTFAGQEGECHGGLTRPSCSRVKNLYPRGTAIRNVRQLSIVSEEELQEIAIELGVDSVDPASIGASLVIKGIPDFTHIPPSSRLQQVPQGVTLCVDMENKPCIYSGRAVEEDCPSGVNIARRFKDCAKGKRGITAWVEREGRIAIGDEIKLFVPTQCPWKLQNLYTTQNRDVTVGDTKSLILSSLTLLIVAVLISYWLSLIEIFT